MRVRFGTQARLLLIALATWTMVLPTTVAAPTAVAAPIPPRAQDPTTDPFYQPPAGFESAAPGTILRQRTVTTAFFGLIPNPVKAYQLLYRTTAIDGSPIATVTTVFKPWIPKKNRFISFHTAYDSSSVTCNPSYQYQLGVVQTSLIASVEMLIIELYLIMGYIVASPDYEGPDAAFGAGRLEGMGALDGMRAVANFGDTLGFSTDSPAVVGTGYSGGAIATGWAAALQPLYAPELNIKGWVQGGTPSNLTGTMVFIDNTVFSGFIPAAIEGLTKPSAYEAQLQPIIDSIITEEGQEILDFAGSNCAVADLLNFFGQSIFSTDVQTMGPDLLKEPTIQAVLAENILGVKAQETPTAPVFVYHATQDEIIPYSNASAMVNSWCKNGADVKFTTYSNGGHATTEIIALPDAVNFVEAAFAGNTSPGCTSNSKLNSLLNPLALGVGLEPVLVQLLNALLILGDQDENVLSNISVLSETV